MDSHNQTVETPRPSLSVLDACAIIVGVVVGVGIFRTPSIVAANVPNEATFLLAWVLGGLVSLAGALCYAELATTYPHAGGDYHYLSRAFGKDMAFLFAWARLVVIQSGSIALLSFVFGDYATQILPLGGPWSPAIYAALAVCVLTTLNVMGVKQGSRTQNLLVSIKILGLTVMFIVGVVLGAPPPQPSAAASSPPAFGLAMILVLLTYGGWNEAAYISSEVREGRRNMARALLWSIGAITTIYVLINLTYLRGLGLATMARSDVVAADLMRQTLGTPGAIFISALVSVAALGSTNATIFTGARTSYALGKDFSLLRFLGRWHSAANTPANALLVQGIIVLLLIALGTWARRGFETMVDYTAPVFWFFFLLTGLSLFVLRTQDPTPRPFTVPLYPLTPLLFCAFCVFMLHSSLAYTGIGALVGVSALLLGGPVLLVARRRNLRNSWKLGSNE